MRISDWSSDVCSSDLAAAQIEKDGELVHQTVLPLFTGSGSEPAADRESRAAVIADPRTRRARLRPHEARPRKAYGQTRPAYSRRAHKPGKRQGCSIGFPDGSVDRKSTRLNSSH